jgi:two-component system chemotaxis response regulator CheY
MALRVMLVDDAVFMRNMLREAFAGSGHEIVAEAADGVEAVEKFAEARPDLVVMDLVMPLRSGIEATREIRRLDKNSRILVCGALGQEPLMLEALDAGADDFMLKPFSREDVLKAVDKVLGK